MKTFILFILTLSITAIADTGTCSGAKSTSGDITVRLYDPHLKASRLVVILPPTGGENVADRKLAKSLCKKGQLVKVLDYPQPPITPKDYDGHERITRQIITAIDSFFDGETRPTTLIGASLGGIYASLLYSLSLRDNSEWKNIRVIDSLVAVVAGGPLPVVLSQSEQKDLKLVREERLKTGSFMNLADYERFMNERIFTDVIKLMATNGNVLFYGSTNDKIVPTKTQRALSHELGGETHWVRGLGHIGTIAFVFYTKAGEIDKFIREL
jgi:pimeloyl-ACP methyl ester carboxylesterase